MKYHKKLMEKNKFIGIYMIAYVKNDNSFLHIRFMFYTDVTFFISINLKHL